MKFADAFKIVQEKNKILVSPHNVSMYIKDGDLYTLYNSLLITELKNISSDDWGYEDRKYSFTEAMKALIEGKYIKSCVGYTYKSCSTTGRLLIENNDGTWSKHCYIGESEMLDWEILDEQGE